MEATKAPSTPASNIERTPISKTPMSAPAGSSRADRTPMSAASSNRVKEEKILVTVRVRPLNKKEASEQVAWECIDEHTIAFTSPTQDRTSSATTCSFDRVFGPGCLAERVYEEGAKDVALSALTGINATIFAYGQTSSGKTYTMRGVTESAVSDIYKHIDNTPERDFIIKISAMEIYNEIVRDLFRPDSGPLRLLDDPVKGTIVERLEEKTVRDSHDLRQLIGKCEAQRQVSETALNDTSSRSHQIIRLTVESSPREKTGFVQSFLAILNFVDLAGSERVAQTNAEGPRLKEGCHINRSLLTLTTVIRRLSDNKRGGHIPYRDSKLTRILQLSLGGNARTAIICTMSPALCHVEQSRNTLFFASRAKEVTNSARVNIVISDKQLLKHLQKEVARLEALQNPDPSSACAEALFLEKDLTIKKMEMEIEELKKERDTAQSQLDELRKNIKEDRVNVQASERHQSVVKCLTFSGSSLNMMSKGCQTRSQVRHSSRDPLRLVKEIQELKQSQKQIEEEAHRVLEVLQKEVACHKLGNQDAAETIARLQAELRVMITASASVKEITGDAVSSHATGANLKEEIARLHAQGNNIAILEAQLENVQRSIDKLVQYLPNNFLSNEDTPKSSKSQSKKKKMLPLAPSNSTNLPNLIRAPSALTSPIKASQMEIENQAPENSETVSLQTPSGSEKAKPSKSEADGDVSSRDGTPGHHRSTSVNMKKMQKMFQNAAEDHVRSIKDYVTKLQEKVAKLQYQKQLLVCQVVELEQNEATDNASEEGYQNVSELAPAAWRSVFKEQMREIIQLWDVCQVSIIHRTHFYLLFRGEPADHIYIEVELRRLTWLRQHFVENASESPLHTGDESKISLSSSIKSLKQEREFLSRRMNSKLTEKKREWLYVRWQIPLEGKHRKLQLVNKLWVDPNDEAHIAESADVVAKLVDFCEGGNISKEMFELNFAAPTTKKAWLLGWEPISNLLGL